MKTNNRSLLLAIGALAVTGTALAQVPSSNGISDGSFNTGIGTGALGGPAATAAGNGNTAVGDAALLENPSGGANSAFGDGALLADTTGVQNTGIGWFALSYNETGLYNTAIGALALETNSSGNRNSAVGFQALLQNLASDNTAMGYNALYINTNGTLNNAVGNFALEFNYTGNNNNAMGYGSLLHNTTGSDNSGQGYFSLAANTTGNLNIGIGYKAGSDLTTGSNNIDIGNVGVAAESAKIRIGTQGTQSAAFVAGIAGTNISGGAAVMVSSSGQLGVVSSSRRYKEDIQPMGTVSERLYQLQPVTFRYKQTDADDNLPIQVGLVAEDVATVMPELVVYNQEGQPESVAYHLLPTLLLNEAQKEHQLVQAQAKELAAVKAQLVAVSAQLAEIDTLRTEVVELRKLSQRFATLQDVGRTNGEPAEQVAMLK
jgi:hypothetical protein